MADTPVIKTEEEYEAEKFKKINEDINKAGAEVAEILKKYNLTLKIDHTLQLVPLK